MASHVLCDCKHLAGLKFRHLDPHFMEPGNFKEISVNKVLHFVQSELLLQAIT